MTALAAAPRPTQSLPELHAHFLAILPRIAPHAKVCFRHLRCPGKRDDAVAEVVAVSWRWYLRIVSQGEKDVNEFVSALAGFAVRHVRAGRKLCRMERPKDVLSPRAQRLHGFVSQSLPAHDTAKPGNPVLEALRDNTATPPPDAAAFRIGYPAWLDGLGEKKRQVAEDMVLGHTTQELAPMHKLSEGRISQLRRELHADWKRFHGEPAFA
jgi:hypothetical protein